MHSTSNLTEQGIRVGTDLLRWGAAGAFYLLILASGYWLARSGKPYGTLVFTLHKLVALAAIVLLGITAYRINRAAGLSALELLTVVVTGLFFVGTMVSGSLLSIPTDKAMPAVVHTLHRVIPYLTVFSTAVTLFLMRGR